MTISADHKFFNACSTGKSELVRTLLAAGVQNGQNGVRFTYHRKKGTMQAKFANGIASVCSFAVCSRTGDRLSKSAPGLATGDYAYTAGTRQLVSIGNALRSNNANGNTVASVVGGEAFGFSYNARNRMAEVQRNGATVGSYT